MTCKSRPAARECKWLLLFKIILKFSNSLFSLCFSKIFKFPVFSLSGITFHNFPCFPCAVGTLQKSLLKVEKTPVVAILFFKMRPKIFQDFMVMNISCKFEKASCNIFSIRAVMVKSIYTLWQWRRNETKSIVSTRCYPVDTITYLKRIS